MEHHKTRLFENLATLQGPMRELMGYSEEDVLNHTDKIRRITRAWTACTRQTTNYSPTEEDAGYQRLLKRGFEEYRVRYAQQQELLVDGFFIAKIATAMATMPAAKRLVIHDCDDEFPMCFRKARRLPFDAQLLDDEKLCEGLFKGQQMSYQVQRHYELGIDAIPVLPILLAALDEVSIHIDSLDIRLSTMGDFGRLESAADIGEKIGSAMRNLKVFDFSNLGPTLVRSHHELLVLRNFLAPIMNGDRLESLNVRLNLWNDDSALDPATMPLVSVVKARAAWPQLSNLILDTLHIEYADLKHLLLCVQSPQGYVGLHKIHLTDGSWSAVLDLLKERHRWANLTSPSGAECEEMSMEEYERVFGPYDGIGNRTQEEEARPEATEAEVYIRGWGAGNPLLSPTEPESG